MGLRKKIKATIDFYLNEQNANQQVADNLRAKYYTDLNCPENPNRQVIMMIDGRIIHGGMADRLRGCVSIFSLCKKTKTELKINFTYPFNLSDYLVPNKYDWKISDDEICYNSSYCEPVKANSSGAYFAKGKIKKLLISEFKDPKYAQTHLYSNFRYDERNYPALFDELFKPSKELLLAIEQNKAHLGENYYSATFRFQQLLGDFKEDDIYKTLSKQEQNTLINKCLDRLKSHIKTLPKGYKLLVTSDSITFLEHAKTLENTYVIPGEIAHMNHTSEQKNIFLKSFIDLYLLKDSKKIALFRTGEMYNSGFPRFASKIGYGKFKSIKF
ncbi:MAG: hypothetical protein R3Y38_01380 [Rikenellaceae bacterium]